MKKICMVLALIFAFSFCMIWTVNAEDSYALNIFGETKSTSKGDTITYEIKAQQKGRIYPASVHVEWSYDSSVFTLINAEIGNLYYQQFEEYCPSSIENNRFSGFIYSEQKEGILVTLTFKVTEDCTAKEYPITLTASYYEDARITENPLFQYYPEISSKYNCYSVATQNGSITVNDHIYGAWTSISDTEHQRICTLCSNPQVAAHAWNHGVVQKPASCISEGLKIYTCTDCGFTREEILPKTADHVYGDWRECDETKHQRSCECGDTQYEPHHLGDLVKHDEKNHKQLCECGYTLYGAHSFGGFVKHDAENHKKVCACGEESYAGHTWDAGVVSKPAQHLEEGIRTHTCTVCRETKEEAIPKTNVHNYGLWQIHNDAEHKRICACGEILYAEHTWNEGVITTPATNTTNGVRTYTCFVCSHEKTEIIPKFEGSQGLAFRENDDGTYYVSGIGTCTDTDIVIPTATPDGSKVVGIGRTAFQRKTITSVVIPQGIEYVEKYAFRYCASLKTVSLPSGLTTLGDECFRGCTSLEKITVYSDVTVIPKNAFAGCTKLTHVTLPSDLKEIGESAFSGCTALQYCPIPQNVTVIGASAFYQCKGLNDTMTIPAGVTAIADKTFSGCTALKAIQLSEGLETIGDSAFDSCTSLSRVAIPNSVTAIGNQAFYDCSQLKQITFGNGLVSIGNSAFSGCTKLKNIKLPETVENLGTFVFNACWGLEEVLLPEHLQTIGASCFAGCENITRVVLPCGMTSIGTDVWSGCVKIAEIFVLGDAEDFASVSMTFPQTASVYFYAEAKPENADGNNYWHYENGEITVWILVQRGDTNGDEQLTAADAVYLLRHVLFSQLYPLSQSGDMNGDGSVSTADAIYLLRHVMFPSLYPLK